MINKRIKYLLAGILFVLCMSILTGCGKDTESSDKQEVSSEISDEEGEPSDNKDNQSGDDLPEQNNEDADQGSEASDSEEGALEEGLEGHSEENEEEETGKKVDLIIFAGQSNMSGCGGDASLAPPVSEEAGMEFRAVSDPTKLYPITEPFGANENNLNGLLEKPGGKKGSMVSSFVNEYHKQTGNFVVAVSASRGETAMSQWLSESIHADVLTRFILSKNWLTENGYEIGHIYMVWLQGESDALKRLSSDAYATSMDDFTRPFFIEGLQKVFFVTPGRTIDETEIYTQIINSQINMSKTSPYYALGTSVLAGVSTEYMVDIYHYNQHVLNMAGMLAADSVAYYTLNNREMTSYDYKNKTLFVPEDGDEGVSVDSVKLDLANMNINDIY